MLGVPFCGSGLRALSSARAFPGLGSSTGLRPHLLLGGVGEGGSCPLQLEELEVVSRAGARAAHRVCAAVHVLLCAPQVTVHFGVWPAGSSSLTFSPFQQR